MTVSFFINKMDLQELNYLVENYAIIPFDKETREKAIIIECFNSLESASLAVNTSAVDLVGRLNREDQGWSALTKKFIQVNVEYIKFSKIQEYLRFI